MAATVRIKDHWNEQRVFTARAFLAMASIGVLAVLLALRLVWLQVVRHDYYVELSQGNRVRLDPIPASRGLILDRNGTVLVDNEPAYQLELIREQTPDLNDTLQRLAALGLIPMDEIDDARRTVLSRRSFDSVPIRLRLSDEEISRFAVHRYEFAGVDLRTRQTRHYPFGQLGVHALGYVAAISEQDLERIDRASYAGTTLIGKLGVESAYEAQLHGHNGYREILVNAQGRSVERQGAYQPELHSAAPAAGADLMLAIDLPAQQVAEEALGGRRGAVVAIDPRNGDVIALVSHPGFDPALFGRGFTRAEYAQLTNDPDKPLLNRALRGAYPSGSTIKPIIALAGLHFKMVDPLHREFCNGTFRLPRSAHVYREGKGGRHGFVDLEDAIARSCDVYFYDLAATLGVEHIAGFMGRFGFGAETGIDIGGEKPGILPSPEWKKRVFKRPQDQVWFPGETVNFGVGQGYLTVTPVQLAQATAMLAGRGRGFRLRLVTGVRDIVSGQVKTLQPVPLPGIDDVASADWDRVVRGMVGATRYGTAAAIGKGAPYTLAGKTGTAQVFSVGQHERYNDAANIARQRNERLRDHSWFIAFAPVEAPRIAISVLVENGGFGASGAAPIARRVMDAYLRAAQPVAAP
ncbi:MAG: penicillin-binding protein 2 [Gammaproteobacteria bacterium]|nr:penicillin-binding protein 2 [Gammaproteobacteria bacterium]